MPDAIVFDLDGTLVDSAPDLRVAVNRMLAERGLGPLSHDRIVSFIGHGIPNLVRQVMQETGTPPDQLEAMTASMLRHYTASPADLTRAYAGVADCLAILRDRGFRMGVCTNKNRAPAVQILNALSLSGFFDVVIGGDSLDRKKPDPAPLRAAFDALGGNGVYVGDSEVDAETADRAGSPFALFTEGYRKLPVKRLRHDLAFSDFAQLPDLIAALTGQAEPFRPGLES